MQSTPTLKDTDPHDVFAIETLLHAHAEKAPPLAHDPAAPSASGAGGPRCAPDFGRRAFPAGRTDVSRPRCARYPAREYQAKRDQGGWSQASRRTANGQMDETRDHGAARPVRRHGCRRLAALWRSGHGDGLRVGAALRAGCIAFGSKPAVAEQPSAPAVEAAATEQAAAQSAAPVRQPGAARTCRTTAAAAASCGIATVAIDGAGSRHDGRSRSRN